MKWDELDWFLVIIGIIVIILALFLIYFIIQTLLFVEPVDSYVGCLDYCKIDSTRIECIRECSKRYIK